MVRLIAATLVAAGVWLASVPLARAAEPTFGTPSVEAAFGKGVTFTQPVTTGSPLAAAEILITFPGAAGPTVFDVSTPSSAGQQTLRYAIDLSDGGHLAPNTKLTAQWRLHPSATDAPILGPTASVTYLDDRFDWKTESGDLVRVHWYTGSDAFGKRALKIAEDAVASSSALLGVTETEPIDFYVYADKESFYDALGPGQRENVGGQANLDIRTMFALITPKAIDQPWVGIVIPHELTHLVFDTAVTNPYHSPPRWLNEGVADYQSQGYHAGYRSTVEEAARSGDLIPLDGLSGLFPTTREQFRLAYAESTAAVDYLVKTYGQDALVTLIRSYASGLTDDEAFSAALGVDTTAFGDAWLASVGAVAPTVYGPQPAAPGPVPSAWAGIPAPGTTTAPERPTAAPSAAPAVVGAASGGEGPGSLIVAGALIAITLAGVLGLYGWRRRQDAAGA